MPTGPVRDQPLEVAFYERDVVAVARDLLGMTLVRAMRAGLTRARIVEVEAYLAQDDPASHAFRGRTRRNASMFGPPGRAYVYAIHARWCLNVVTEPAGVGSAVLIRAVEPVCGEPLMRERRGLSAPGGLTNARITDARRLTGGPARVCEALAVDRTLDGWDLTRGRRLWVACPRSDDHDALASALPVVAPRDIVCTPRIGVTSGQDLPLRFCIAESRFLSRRRPA
jgi:DNA-3-methyladenine glycosylase